MNIQLLSDLHLEAHPHFVPVPATGAEALLLAGDIGPYQTGSQISSEDCGLERLSPVIGWPTPLRCVPGTT